MCAVFGSIFSISFFFFSFLEIKTFHWLLVSSFFFLSVSASSSFWWEVIRLFSLDFVFLCFVCCFLCVNSLIYGLRMQTKETKKRKKKISLKRDAIKTKTIIIAWGPFLLLFLWYRPRCVYFGSILCNAITKSVRSVDRPQTSCRFLIEIWRRSIWHAQFRCEMKTIQLTCFHNKHTIIHSFDRFNWTLLFWPIEKGKKTKKYIEF